MKSLVHASFMRTFDLVLGVTNPGIKSSAWRHEETDWKRERHSFSGPIYGQSVEVIIVTCAGRPSWKLMIVKEYWWAGQESRTIRTAKWATALDGQRANILAWFRVQERLIDQTIQKGSHELTSRPKQRLSIKPLDDRSIASSVRRKGGK